MIGIHPVGNSPLQAVSGSAGDHWDVHVEVIVQDPPPSHLLQVDGPQRDLGDHRPAAHAAYHAGHSV